MSRLFLALALTFALTSGCTETGVLAERPSRGQLDSLFSQLKTASTAEEAERLEIAILGVLGTSGNPEVDTLTIEGLGALNEGDLDRALDTFNVVVARAPRFVEGWNLRATVHWMRDEHQRAITDLRRVLALEPRHFGAMTLLGRIFTELHQPKAAMVMLEYALEINPHLDTAREQMEMLRDQVAGLPI